MAKDTKPRLRKKYEDEIVEKLLPEYKIKNKLAAPKVMKVAVNMGLGEAVKNKEVLDLAREDLAKITGQKPSTQLARISVASFGVRAGNPVGLKVTLRGDRMYDFLDRFFSIVLPRLRDFRGVPLDSFDKNGNYSFGVREHTVFPEIELGKLGSKGLEITIVTNIDDVDMSKRLLELMGMPFVKDDLG